MGSTAFGARYICHDVREVRPVNLFTAAYQFFFTCAFMRRWTRERKMKKRDWFKPAAADQSVLSCVEISVLCSGTSFPLFLSRVSRFFFISVDNLVGANVDGAGFRFIVFFSCQLIDDFHQQQLNKEKKKQKHWWFIAQIWLLMLIKQIVCGTMECSLLLFNWKTRQWCYPTS